MSSRARSKVLDVHGGQDKSKDGEESERSWSAASQERFGLPVLSLSGCFK